MFTVRYEIQTATKTIVREYKNVAEDALEGMNWAVRKLIAKPGDTVLRSVTAQN